MAKSKPWNTDWERVRPLGRGGHGSTQIVRRRGNGGEEFVLKTLNSQSDPERRRRMRREAQILETLQHPGIPRYVECNTAAYRTDELLYLVEEYVPGPTLLERVTQTQLKVAEATSMTLALVDIVGFCHERDIGHRDIKPDNVVLRDGNVERPVLIDFGQSFNLADESTSEETATLQQMGNRFLVLPELLSPTSGKRDLRSDLAACCGLALYAMTAVPPVTLRDADGRPPHETNSARNVWDTLKPHEVAALLRVFGTGFQYELGERWQSASDLRDALKAALAPEPDAPADNVDEILRRISAARTESETRRAGARARGQEVADAVTTLLEPHLHLLLAGIADRRQQLPITVKGGRLMADNTPSLREMLRIAANNPRRGHRLIDLVCGDAGVKPFHVHLECVYEDGPAQTYPISFRLSCRHEGVGSNVNLDYRYRTDGSLLRDTTAVPDDDIQRQTFAWMDTPDYWGYPA